MPRNYMRLELPALAENVGLCRLSVATFAAGLGFTVPEIDEIKVMVSEAVSNAVVHGYRGDGGRLCLEAVEREDGIELIVSDEGCGIADLEKAREPSYSSDPERMGLGFTFMESFSDAMEVHTEVGKGTSVRLVKRRESGRAD